jgi:hypothetical protein
VTRAEALATGALPDDLEPVAAPAGSPAPRDVFLYVISGHKARNPLAAMALQERLAARHRPAGAPLD